MITLSFLLFAFTTKLPLAFADDKCLLAKGGEPIATGELVFYILATYPPIESEGGGLILGQTRNSTCPLTVLQHYSSGFNGLPVLLTSPQDFNTSSNVSTSTPLDTTFLHKPINCAKSFRWVVVVDDDFPHPWVGVGGEQDYPGKKIMSSRFHIQRFNRGYIYKLVFCPTSSTSAPSSLGGCKNIGRYHDVHGRRLILTNMDPFHVVFLRSY